MFIIFEVVPIKWKPTIEYRRQFRTWNWLYFSFTVVTGWKWIDFISLVEEQDITHERVSRKASLVSVSDMISEGGPVHPDGGFQKALGEWDDNQKKAQTIIDAIPDRPVEGK